MPEMPSIRYRVAMPAPASHLFEVRVAVTLGSPAPAVVRCWLPAWTPGSYLIREFARHVQAVQAESSTGAPLPVRKLDKATWEVATRGASEVALSYRVYAHDLSVRTSHLDASHGFFNPANLLMAVGKRLREPLELTVVPAPGWRVAVALPETTADPPTFLARDYDELVDSPVECGPHQEIRFEAHGIPHRWVGWGEPVGLDRGELVAKVTPIVETEAAIFGGLPADLTGYLFIAHTTEKRGGGLEHKAGQVIGLDRLCWRDAKKHEDFLTLVAHEYFHLWNVKRIRAAGLGPFDYTRETYTPLLWLMEGVTGYYDTLVPVRAGLISPARYLEILGERMGELMAVPGRRLDSLEEASHDTWIKLYRPDENSPNATVSYYLKGELVGLLLDLHLRAASGGEASLDQVMRELWRRYLTGGGAVEPREIDGLFHTATGVDVSRELEHWVRGRGELPFEDVLSRVGLALEGDYLKKYDRTRLDGPNAKKAPAPTLGLTTEARDGRLLVKTVRADGPCALAGVHPGDEIVALDGSRAANPLDAQLATKRVGERVELTLFRRDLLIRAEAVLAVRPFDRYKLSAKGAAEAQRRLLQGWLGQAPPD
jgi:predicted metalloprotease with PDZ domain